jgi:periplasmic mercuric ion binding protein
MKTLRTLIAAAFCAASFATQAAEPGTVKFQVNGMVCAFCAQGIEKRLTAMPETGEIYINLGQKVVAVQPKTGQKLNVDKVKAEVTEAGYDVTKVEPVAQTVAQIRAEMKAKK